VKWKNKFHERRALQKADGLISVSQFTADVTNEVFGFQKYFSIIPNSIDVNLFNGNNNIEANVNNKSKILYFGSLIRKKGLLELPLIFNEVIRKNPEAQLVLVGKDVSDIVSGKPSTWAMMQELFTSEALQNVMYLGIVPYQEIKKQIDFATVCVFPSFAEALPVSWIEAMALQKPIVASNIGWATEVIEDAVEGFLVHPNNHKQYAAKILELLANPKMQKDFGVAARKKVVAAFSMQVVAQKSVSFYKKVIRIQ